MGSKLYIFGTIVFVAAIMMQLNYDMIADNIDIWANDLLMKGYLPDFLIRFGIRMSLKQRLKELEIKTTNTSVQEYVDLFVQQLKENAMTAEATKEANEQHYEVDVSFYNKILGYYYKYSSTIYLNDIERQQQIYTNEPSIPLHIFFLNQSEIDMLNVYIERAELCVGNDCNLNVLDLGCGWGSFSLYYALQCPLCTITPISNSKSQIEFIKQRAKKMGLNNVFPRRVNVNELDQEIFDKKMDRIISIEMFEHMKNYKKLLNDLKNIMNCNGKLFVHMFVHKDKPYHFDKGWMAQYFFSGGTMPSFNMLEKFNDDFDSVASWKVNGRHYSYTLESWLLKMDNKQKEIEPIIGNIYGNNQKTITKWVNLWRTFFMACSELFKMNDGTEWFVGHYLLLPKC
eukprot:275581_1